MSRAEAVLRRIVENLRNLRRRFALVGGLAVSARTEPRLTRLGHSVELVTTEALSPFLGPHILAEAADVLRGA